MHYTDSYDLEVISMEQGHEDKQFIKYFETDKSFSIGTLENEPFVLFFKNKTHNNVIVNVKLNEQPVILPEKVNAYGFINIKNHLLSFQKHKDIFNNITVEISNGDIINIRCRWWEDLREQVRRENDYKKINKRRYIEYRRLK